MVHKFFRLISLNKLLPLEDFQPFQTETCVSAGCLFQACEIDVFSRKLAENAQEGLQANYV